VNLQDGLDELRNGILRDASALKSGPTDHFWQDLNLSRYIDDAQKRFARLSLCIRDSTTPAVTQVVLVGDGATDIYQLDPSVLFVTSARHQDDSKDMVRMQHPSSVGTQNTFTETYDFASYPVSGKPTMYTTDEGLDPNNDHAIRIRFFGMPLDQSGDTETGKIVYLRTIRKPLVTLDLTQLGTDFEIPSEYQLDMLEWAAYRALRNVDIDGEDRTKAEAHKKRFEEAIAECKKDIRRKLWQQEQWGFGGNGFTYLHN
jgi:hypothetical protein